MIYFGEVQTRPALEPTAPPAVPPQEPLTEAAMQASERPVRHHLLMGGIGRAGTTFMVQYLTACGLDMHSWRHPDAQLEEQANPGLEDLPIGDASNLPYVIETPWRYESIDKLVEEKNVVIDAVIIIMRDIVEAATSRVMLEMRARRPMTVSLKNTHAGKRGERRRVGWSIRSILSIRRVISPCVSTK